MIGVVAAARRAAALVFETLLPADCLRCGAWLPLRQEGGVCLPCWERLPWRPGRSAPRRGPLDALLWGADYDGDFRRLIRIYKFERFDPLGRPLGRAAARRLPAGRLRRDDFVVVPVPLHWTRRWRRGFNPAALLAQGLAGALGLPLRPDALRRRRRGRRQVGLGRRERRAALAGVFVASRGAARAIRGRDILLVDDVVTTGATLEACAAALLAGGARSVVGFAVARTPRPGAPRRGHADSGS
jgi:ComF family protein